MGGRVGGQVRTLRHVHTRSPRIHVRACKPSRRGTRVRITCTCAHTRHISSRVPASERTSERTNERALACGRESEGDGRRGEERHTGDVILKGRNNIDVDLLKSRLFLARAPPSALPFRYFERPSRNRVDFSTELLTDRSLIIKRKKIRRSRRRRNVDSVASNCSKRISLRLKFY